MMKKLNLMMIAMTAMIGNLSGQIMRWDVKGDTCFIFSNEDYSSHNDRLNKGVVLIHSENIGIITMNFGYDSLGHHYNFRKNGMVSTKGVWFYRPRKTPVHHGTWYYWDKNGVLTKTEVWNKGEKVSEQYTDTKGAALKESKDIEDLKKELLELEIKYNNLLEENRFLLIENEKLKAGKK